MTVPGIKSIAHLALRVSDLDRSLAFYRDTLGFREMLRLHEENGDPWLVCLRISDTQSIELFPSGSGDRAPDRDASPSTMSACKSNAWKKLSQRSAISA